VRGVEALAEGRGWRITVQPLAPGIAVVPPMDLGDGRSTRELRLTVPRTVAFRAPWMGVGGGAQDRLPPVAFPWPWTLPLLLPLAAAAWLLAVHHRRRAPERRRRAARKEFARHWPPPTRDRAALDAAHAAGRTLLAARFGPEALSWSAQACHEHGLDPWARWLRNLDAARFDPARTGPDPAEPSLEILLAALGGR
jgi:hypothetical protein